MTRTPNGQVGRGTTTGTPRKPRVWIPHISDGPARLLKWLEKGPTSLAVVITIGVPGRTESVGTRGSTNWWCVGRGKSSYDRGGLAEPHHVLSLPSSRIHHHTPARLGK